MRGIRGDVFRRESSCACVAREGRIWTMEAIPPAQRKERTKERVCGFWAMEPIPPALCEEQGTNEIAGIRVCNTAYVFIVATKYGRVRMLFATKQAFGCCWPLLRSVCDDTLAHTSTDSRTVRLQQVYL